MAPSTSPLHWAACWGRCSPPTWATPARLAWRAGASPSSRVCCRKASARMCTIVLRVPCRVPVAGADRSTASFGAATAREIARLHRLLNGPLRHAGMRQATRHLVSKTDDGAGARSALTTPAQRSLLLLQWVPPVCSLGCSTCCLPLTRGTSWRSQRTCGTGESACGMPRPAARGAARASEAREAGAACGLSSSCLSSAPVCRRRPNLCLACHGMCTCLQGQMRTSSAPAPPPLLFIPMPGRSQMCWR